MIDVQTLKDRGITLQSYEYCPSRRKTIHDPEVIVVTLQNSKGELFKVTTYCANRKHVLRPDEYLQLVLDRYHETAEQSMKRSWQYQQWGDPIWRGMPQHARPGYGAVCRNERDYYLFDPYWYTNNVEKPLQAFRKKFETFITEE